MPRYHFYAWTEEEERVLAETMLSGRKQRKKMDELLSEASVKLERTVSSCSNRWYEIRKDYISKSRNKAV